MNRPGRAFLRLSDLPDLFGKFGRVAFAFERLEAQSIRFSFGWQILSVI
jgi:hypothetical protein